MSLQESQKRKVKICIVAILLLIVIASLIFVKSKNTTKIVTDKELLKAMTYAEVIDGEGSIENTENNVSFDVFFMRDLDGDGIEEKLRGTLKRKRKKTWNILSCNTHAGCEKELGKTAMSLFISFHDNG